MKVHQYPKKQTHFKANQTHSKPMTNQIKPNQGKSNQIKVKNEDENDSMQNCGEIELQARPIGFYPVFFAGSPNCFPDRRLRTILKP